MLNNAGGGVDTVQSSVTFSLATRTNIENLTLTGGGDINGTGNALANEIVGNSGKNVSMAGPERGYAASGGAGNDTYIVDNAGGYGRRRGRTPTAADEVKIEASFIGRLQLDIENYIYTGTKAWSFTGTTDRTTRSAAAAANDTLNGGDGNDTLLGNGGNDLADR